MTQDTLPDLDAFNARYAGALVSGDVVGLVSMYDEDAIMLGAGLPPVEGRTALGAYYEGVAAAGLQSATLTSDRARLVDDVVVDTGRYAMTIQPADADAVSDAGKYVHVLRRQGDGTWHIWHDMFVSDGAVVSDGAAG